MKTTKIKIRPKHKNRLSKVLPHNMIDKDVQSMLLPLNLLKIIPFFPKYRIRNNLIIPNNHLLKSVSLCCTISIIIFLFCNIFYRHSMFNAMNRNYLKKISKITNGGFLSVWLINNFIHGAFKTKENVSFVLKFQDIHRFLNNDKKFKLYVIQNWVTIVLFAAFYSFMIIVHMLPDPIFLQIFEHLSTMTMEAEMVYAIRLIQLLKDKVNLWNDQALQYHSMEVTHCKRMFQAYIKILDCFDIYKISFQNIVSITLPIFLIFMHSVWFSYRTITF